MSNFTKTKTFIIPSFFGLVFGLLCLLLLLVAIGSSNNMLYLITFFIVSIGFLALLCANMNVARVEIQSKLLGEFWTNLRCEVSASIVNTSGRRTAHLLDMAFVKEKEFFRSKSLDHDSARINHLEAGGVRRVRIPWKPMARGRQRLPRLFLQSRFPMGLFRPWKIFKLDTEIVVFPEKKGEVALPASALINQDETNAGLFQGYREFQNGDSPRRIDWRVSSRRQELLVKIFEITKPKQYIFSWSKLPLHLNHEEKISQLALWVELAEKSFFEYGLQLPGEVIEVSTGVDHFEKCLTSLALMDGDSSAPPTEVSNTGPQKSSIKKETERLSLLDDPSLVFLVFVAILTGSSQAEIWATALALLGLLTRVVLEKFRRISLSTTLISGLSLGSGLLVYLKFHSFYSKDVALNLLLIQLGLKLFDFNRLADKRFIVLMCMLLFGLLPMYSVDIYWLVPILFGFSLGFYTLLSEAKLKRPIGFLAKMIGLAVPLMIFLFFFFPRVVVPWANWLGSSKFSGMVGFSNRLAPGGIANLLSRDELVFRAQFIRPNDSGAEPVTNSGGNFYWKGGALFHPRGLSWTPLFHKEETAASAAEKAAKSALGKVRTNPSEEPNKHSAETSTLEGPPAQKNILHYNLVLEPTDSRILFTLDRTEKLKFNSEIQAVSRYGNVFEYLKNRTENLVYEGDAEVDFRDEIPPQSFELELYSQPSPRLLEFIEKIKGTHETQEAQLESLKDYFKKGGFEYSLTPGTYGSDSDSGSESTDELEEFLFKRKRGFCEHFASSYAYLARLLGIPSRVIVGFHGGEYNTLGDFWKVSTQDAHAWVEVYVQNHWQRQDPTVWIDGFAIQTSNQEFLGFGFLSHKNRQKYALLGRFIDWLSSTLDFINYRWTNFLIEFDSGVQAGLLVRGKTFLKSMGSWWVWTLILGMLGSALRLRRGLAIGKGKPQPQGLFDPVLNELSMWFDMHLGSPRLKGETPLHYIERVRQRLLLELDKVELNKKSPLETTQKSIQNSLSVSDLKNLKKLKDEFLPFLSIELDEVLYAKRSSQYTATAYRKLFVSKSKFVIK